MKTILIGGGSGLIGSRLSLLLTTAGYEVRHLSRSTKKEGPYRVYQWDPANNTIDPSAFEGVDYIINLAGAGIADQRWTPARKKRIIDSRVQSTELLLREAAPHADQIRAFLSASAVGFYGDRGEEWLEEDSDAGTGFLSESVQAWEESVFRHNTGIRTAVLRIGLVLSTEGGALPRLIGPGRFGMFPYFGNGRQWYSWIHIEDLCRMFHFLLEQDSAEGVYNAVAPGPHRNREFTSILRKAMGMPGFSIPVPEFLLRLPMGEMADVVLSGSKVRSEKIRTAGFTFQHPELEEALRDLLSRKM